MNFSTHPSDLDKFSGDYNKIKQFLKKHAMHGLELIQYSPWNDGVIPSSMIHGLHMRFWPMWLDFWRNDKSKLIKQFGEKSTWVHYYGGESRDAIIEHYQKELKDACAMGAKYVVFHVCHVQLEHSYTYSFDYTDSEIIEAFIEMINEVLEGFEPSFDLLLENLWWPGLTMLDKKNSTRLMERIKYPNKGFMMDIGHLMNTNKELKREEEATDYILEVLDSLEDLAVNIKGIHLNSSLSGEYVKREIASYKGHDYKGDFFNRYVKAFSHISQIDRHTPFTHPSIKKVIDYVRPQYLVYEFISESLNELDKYIKEQDRALESII
ncbi:TIM barrel protein [Alkalibaculum bacchi]|uniref:TIM barrel protein n=1 Tax=Alkalibaculum bacchi TaxID=645887 RepID=UPI0026ECDF8D|nr:TIM barrel protein [Alkalibaculum bacchi]